MARSFIEKERTAASDEEESLGEMLIEEGELDEGESPEEAFTSK